MIYYAGQTLLTDRPDGELSAWLDRMMPLADMSLWGVVPEAERSYSHGPRHSRSAEPSNVGFPRMNYPPRWKPRINALYWPTGAGRWATFLGLCDESTKNRILGIVQNTSDHIAEPAQLVLAANSYRGATSDNDFDIDQNSGLVRLSTEMYLLRPRRVSQQGYYEGSTEPLWLLPLVDERYWWQFRRGDTDIIEDTPWLTMILEMMEERDADSFNVSEVDADFGLAPVEQWGGQRRLTMAVGLDAVALSCGQRIVRSVTREVRSISPADSITTLDVNIDPTLDERVDLICGGDLSNENRYGAQPAGVEVVFTLGPNAYRETDVIEPDNLKSVAAGTVPDESGNVGTSGVKRFFTTARAEPLDPEDTLEDIETRRSNFAKAVAKAYFGWKQRAFDYVYAGIKYWHPTGFDDAVEWRMDWDAKTKCHAFYTRVQSMPDNVGFSDLPCKIDPDLPKEIRFTLKETLETGGVARASLDTFNPVDRTWEDSGVEIKVCDGLGLCEPAEADTPGYAVDFGGTRGYLVTALLCECTST